MIRRLLGRQKFSSEKFFADEKYTNICLYSENQLGGLRHIASACSSLGVDMVFIKSQFCNVWSPKKKFMLDISILKEGEATLKKLEKALYDVGVQMEVYDRIEVPWFPRSYQELDNIGQVLLDVKDIYGSDSPQFMDPEYRERRNYIAKVAREYKYGK